MASVRGASSIFPITLPSISKGKRGVRPRRRAAPPKPHLGDKALKQQSVYRGFFDGVVCQKLGLKLESEKADGERIYRIAAGKAAASGSETAARPSA
jgi:hypothetical protein